MTYDTASIYKIAFPVFISFLIGQIISITDVIFLSRLGTTAVGAAGLGATYFLAMSMIISGFSLGAQIIISRRNGEQNLEKTGEVFYQGLLFLVLVSLFLIGISRIFASDVLKILIKDKQVFQATEEYVKWRVFGLLATSLIMMFRAFFVGIVKTFILQASSIVMIFSNIFLNYALIFGHFGFEALGIKGAAIASVISEFVAAGVYVVYLCRKIEIKKYGFCKICYKNFGLLKSILDVSIWTMLQQFVSISTWFLFFVAIEHLGKDELAISNILRNSAGLPWSIVFAFGAVSGTMTSNLIGEGKSEEVIGANKKIISLNVKVISATLFVFALFYYPILRIYSDNTALINKAIPAYMTALTCYLPLFSGWIWFQAVAATGYTRRTMLIELIAMTFYMLYISVFILCLKMPLYICMFADGVYNLVIFVMSYRFMRSEKWIGKKV